ncbi:hypothetical protein AAFF_G00174160 [Aldrovandia affinis]|uniref:Uncharacterized protein n=1 Tax=Aldrovandia affinis TaxID=143900 RepID=A0AAD7SZ25_9TELE|nr:hypothetical protein AAFF_G00174160 [Aldrovandia affinis]
MDHSQLVVSRLSEVVHSVAVTIWGQQRRVKAAKTCSALPKAPNRCSQDRRSHRIRAPLCPCKALRHTASLRKLSLFLNSPEIDIHEDDMALIFRVLCTPCVPFPCEVHVAKPDASLPFVHWNNSTGPRLETSLPQT